jgi:chromatin remodeling complex protein RSC6
MSKPDTTVENSTQPSVSINEEIHSQFMEIVQTLSTFKTTITMLSTQIKTVERNVKKNIKRLEKESKKNKNKGNRKASGFAVPTKISKDLCKFMGVKEGTQLARTEVTKYIIQYIKDNKLPDETNKKIIKPNSKLKSLLKLEKNDEVTYFNLQKYMNKHFVK